MTGTNDPREDRLTALLSDAVSDVEPADRLHEIRSRTRPAPARRGWLYAGGGAVLVAATVVTAVALTGGSPGPALDPAPDRGPAAPSSETPREGRTVAVAAYYVGDTPLGPRLYREFHQEGPGDPLTLAVAALTTPPEDPDYRTPWPAGFFVGAAFDGTGDDGLVGVTVADTSLRDRPAGLSAEEAAVAVQQVVHTVQAAAQSQAAVQFLQQDGNPIDQLLGVPTGEPLAAAPQLDVLALMSISDPAEGLVAEDGFVARGRASSFEATVGWQVLDASDETVLEGFTTAAGWADRLYPWEAEVDVSDLAPGAYTFVASTDDPTGGTEGPGPTSDTRTVVVR